MFLLQVTKNKSNEYEFSKADLIKNTNINLEVGDRLAINEIEGTIIVYRGYTD